MSKVKQTGEYLNRAVKAQFGFLVKSAIDYDKESHDEAKRLALAMRVLLYDSQSSLSLLEQLGLKNILFCCTCNEEFYEGIIRSGSSCLTSVFMGSPQVSKWLPILESPPAN